MSDLMEYKCTSCGGHLEFDAALQKMKCPYCDSVFDISEFEDETKSTFESDAWSQDEIKKMRIYGCQSCGGEVIGDENLGASRCPYCGNTVVMKGQFSGDLRPDLILPFSKTKEEAISNLEEHVKKSKFTPNAYKSRDNLEEIKGLYVPFWLYDATAKFDMTYSTRALGAVWREGDYDCVEYEDYRISKEGTMDFENIPVDASRKMADELMDALEPFDIGEAIDFNPAYMAGFLADRYDVEQSESQGRLESRVDEVVNMDIRNSISGYSSVECTKNTVSIPKKKVKYALLPVWILSTTWENEIYTYVMNGQTGKVAGRIPVDRRKFRNYWLKSSAVISLILFIIMWFVL